MSSIFTSFCNIPIGRQTWYTIRPLTMDDVTWTDWVFSPYLNSGDISYSDPKAFCTMTVNPEVLELLPDMDSRVVGSFFVRYYSQYSSSFRSSCVISEPVSYVGIRKNEQWKKFNEVLAKVRERHLLTADDERKKVLDKLNKDMAEFVRCQNESYLSSAVSFYSNVGNYQIDELDTIAGNKEINERIKALREEMDSLREKRDVNRDNALKNYWISETPVEKLPEVVIEAIRAHLRDKGPTRASSFFER